MGDESSDKIGDEFVDELGDEFSEVVTKFGKKHHKNCECCPVSQLIVR